MKDNKDIKGIIITFILAVLWIIFGSAIMFWAGYLDGLIIKWIFGEWIIKAFSLIHLNIEKDQIPLLFGLIGVISAFFKTYTTNNKNKD